MARTQRLAGPRGRTGPPVRLLAGLITAAALAVAGCGSAAAPGAQQGPAASGTRPAASGTGQASPAGSARVLSDGRGLCARPGAPSRVIISRITGPRLMRPMGPVRPLTTHRSRPPHEQKLLRRPILARTITDPARVHALARALCALPLMPRGPISCPAEFPGGFQLLFLGTRRDLPIITVQASGCREVTGLGAPRWAAQSPAFWKLLNTLSRPIPWNCQSMRLPCPAPPRATSVPHS